ncbi:MAG: MBOAT family protein, partial [Oscillospiraceae bacterium]|nr:MBOAT family protein [Oscillospiraceae bacterium]
WGLTGLWHGAAWTFIVWGMYFGVILIMERLFLRGRLEKIPVICHIYTICAFMFGWVIFRAESIPHIGSILSALAGRNGPGSMLELSKNGLINPTQIIMIIIGIICSTPVLRELKKIFEKNEKTVYIIDAASVIVLILCVITLAKGAYNPFIYFRF